MVGFQNNGWPDGIPRSQMLFLHRNIAKSTSRHAYMSILDDFLIENAHIWMPASTFVEFDHFCYQNHFLIQFQDKRENCKIN